MNPELDVHDAYTSGQTTYIPEIHRVALTRLRLSSVQDEEHAMLSCALTSDIRSEYLNNVNSMFELFFTGLPNPGESFLPCFERTLIFCFVHHAKVLHCLYV